MTRTLLLITTLVFAQGCASISDYRYRSATERRAKAAWRTHKTLLSDQDRNIDFGDGFKVGYEDVCRGGDGMCPAVPPSYFWDAKFQCAVGAERVETWYRGFELGAQVALIETDKTYNVPSNQKELLLQN